MRINKDIIEKLNPCNDRFNNFKIQYPEFDNDIREFILLENITYNDKVWVITRLFTKEQNIKWSLLCASKVLNIFETEYPQDKRPRLALEACENYLNNPSDENKNAAASAASAASAAASAASAAASAASASAASASYAAASAAAYYAASAAYAASYAASAYYAAASAASAYYAASSINVEEEINLLLMIECL